MLSWLKTRYERRSPVALVYMALLDAFCWVAVRLWSVAPKCLQESELNKVLLVNPAHIGDVVISTAAIRRLKTANPRVSIGLLVGSWSKPALLGHPAIDRIFIVDHWRLNRSNISTARKVWRYIQTWREAQRALIAEGYDAGVLLNSFTPNLASLLWFSKIPVRVGYVSAGMSPLLSEVLPKPLATEAEQAIQLKLLEHLGIYGASNSWLMVPKVDASDEQKLGVTSPFVVLHPGTGNFAKSWSLSKWVEVAQCLNEMNLMVVLTGHGSQEYALANVIANQARCVNLVGQLSWEAWMATLRGASVVIGLDSAVGHVCAALNKSFVGIYSGIGTVSRWSPQGSRIKILTHEMACSPCHTRPCLERLCIMSVKPSDVVLAAKQFL